MEAFPGLRRLREHLYGRFAPRLLRVTRYYEHSVGTFFPSHWMQIAFRPLLGSECILVVHSVICKSGVVGLGIRCK